MASKISKSRWRRLVNSAARARQLRTSCSSCSRSTPSTAPETQQLRRLEGVGSGQFRSDVRSESVGVTPKISSRYALHKNRSFTFSDLTLFFAFFMNIVT